MDWGSSALRGAVEPRYDNGGKEPGEAIST